MFAAGSSLILILFWGLLFITQDQIEEISLEHRLVTETAEYFNNYRAIGYAAPKPDPQELDTYWSMQQSIPAWLKLYQTPGFFEEQRGTEDKHFLVEKHPSGKGFLYVVYQDDADDYLDEYEDKLHIITFIVGFIFLLSVLLCSFYFIRLFSTPLRTIGAKIDAMTPEMPNFKVDSLYQETRNIEQALLDKKTSISVYFKREQEFSCFASHELRTPIMVIKGSTDLLKKMPDQPAIMQKAIARIEFAANEMQILTETFLLLGREKIEKHHVQDCLVADNLNCILDNMRQHFSRQESTYEIEIKNSPIIQSPSSFVNIVFSNLIKNAFSYSSGNIQISLNKSLFTIINQHNGHDMDNAGYGCGLVIVERICTRMGWQFSSQCDEKHYSALIDFDAEN